MMTPFSLQVEGVMSRTAAAIHCTEEERIELERLSKSKSRTGEARWVERAKLVLRCLAGRRNDEVAAEFGIQAATVGIWRRRFASEGLSGLNDRARSGKPPAYPAAELRQRILKQLEAPPPAGLAGWDGGTLAKALAVPTMPSGECCVRRVSNCGFIARGVSALIQSLPQRRQTSSACT